MSELFSGNVTTFDVIAIAVILISALMAFARGFLRELATLGAFIIAIAAAYYARVLFRDPLAEALPETMAPWTADFILVAVAFVAFYVVIAWLGTRLSKMVQGFEGMGMIDRVSGLVFGAARGFVALAFFSLLVKMSPVADKLPPWIADASLYPYFSTVADTVHTEAPRIAEDLEERLPVLPPASSQESE